MHRSSKPYIGDKMTFNPARIPAFNKVQMDLLNDLNGLDAPSIASLWLGELDGGEPLAAAVLAGPITGGNPMTEKRWDRLELTGEGRAMVILWIDNRKVATGMLNMTGGALSPNRLNIPQKVHTGNSLLALIIFQGRMLGCKAYFEPMG
jgi:hypothetical protein